jgi:PAS domain S-box-containing protein
LREALDRIHPGDRERVDAAYAQALAGGPRPLEYRIVRPNGEIRMAFCPGTRLVTDDSGAPLQIVGVTQDITERKKAEEALRESEERFRQLAENIKDVFWLLDWTEQKIIYASPAYETVWGRPIGQLQDDPLDWIDAIHPDDRDRAQDAYFPAAVTSYNEVYRIIRPDGSMRWIHHRGFPIEDESKRVYRMAGIAEDITEQKLAEAALRKSEERYRALYDNNPSMYFTVDGDGIVTAVNEFGAEQLGYTVEELIGQPVLEIFHPDDRNAVHGQLGVPEGVQGWAGDVCRGGGARSAGFRRTEGGAGRMRRYHRTQARGRGAPGQRTAIPHADEPRTGGDISDGRAGRLLIRQSEVV